MPPFYETVVTYTDVDCFSQKYPHQKGHNWEQIIESSLEIPLGETDAKQYEVSGLPVGKDLPSEKISIRVEKSSGHRKKNADGQGFGYSEAASAFGRVSAHIPH